MRKIADMDTKRLLVNVPYGHSKSTCLTLFTTLHAIALDPNVQIGILSGSARMAQRFVHQIREFLTNPIMYKGSEGNLLLEGGPFVNDAGRLGNRTEFRVRARESADKEPTVSAYGVGEHVQGTRFDRIVCDDIATTRNHKNPERIDDMELLVTQDLQSRLDETGQLIVVGTRVGPGDIYGRLEILPAYEVVRFPCVLSYDDEETLWPEHFNFEAAMRQKGSMAPERWELVYQNSDYMSQGASFTREQLDRCHSDRVMGELPKGVGLDLFIGFTAMILMGIDRSTGRRYLVDLVNHRSMTQPQMMAQAFDWVSRYRVRSFRYEAVALQSQIFETAEWRMRMSAHGVRMDQHRTHAKAGVGGKWDAGWGVEAMSVSFHNAMVDLPWGDARTQRAIAPLEEQLMRFPMEGAPTDVMMAYWIADTGCRLVFERGATRKFSDRQHAEPVPRHMLNRRRVHSGGSSRMITGRDFGYGRGEQVPFRLANMDAGDVELEEMFDG
jgi:hypothetical protein